MLIRQEKRHSINGVQGRLNNLHVPPLPWVPGVFANQTWVSEARPVKGYGTNGAMSVNIRFDDNCKNGHMSFAITADVYTTESRRQRDIAAGGCLHEEIEKVFPELAPLIKWHLMATDGPMHYVANTVYHASDRDHNGLLKGEFRQIRNGRTGLLCWTLECDAPKYFDGENPPVVAAKYVPFGHTGVGKARDFAAARRSAVWPDATDEQLSLPKAELTEILLARLPALIEEFRGDMERIGFVWEAPARG